MDLTLYWFMFPVAICVATAAMLSGIGGAALFTPIFILVLPMLGPEYPLQSTVAAIGTALLTEAFGFYCCPATAAESGRSRFQRSHG